MKLVDTSIWVDYLHGARAAAGLSRTLEEGEVLLHPWVYGELALGNLGGNREAILRDLMRLPQAPVAAFEELLGFVERYPLAGAGIGWVDLQLLASAKLAAADLWTSDRGLARAWSQVT